MPVILHHTEYRQKNANLLQSLFHRRRMIRAAVYEQEIRTLRKLLLVLKIVFKPARNRFPHRGVVVLGYDPPDPEFTIVPLKGPSPDKNGHRRHNAFVAHIGDIEGLYPFGRGRKLQHPLQPLQSFQRLLDGRCGPGAFLAGIGHGRFHQTQPVSPFGRLNRDLFPGCFGQHPRQRLRVLNVAGEQHGSGPCAPACIILANKAGNRFGVVLQRLVHQLEILPGQIPVHEMQDGKAGFCPPAETHGVRVRIDGRNNALPVRQSLYRPYPVPQGRGQFKAHSLRSLQHFRP